MAENERLGASFSIDVTDLKTGLAQANRLIRESQSEFKAAAAGMDDWTKSEDGLNAKIKSLSDITEIQRKKVSALKTEYQRLIDNGLDPASRQAVELRTRINNEETALRSNERELRRQQDALKDVSEESEKTGKSFEKVGEIAKTACAIAVTAIAAAGAAIGALVKSSLESYAEYEQLVGGVDTLFKESSKKVQEYANNAYKTAGMSANEYMETVTGFSASLLQSLGGDTEKAADLADKALTDMSDNANKMGTDMESIKNAYGGFAKQNFTMLDNLKLGYGGTQEEMKRLLADAEKFSGIKYDISSYADIVEAIHVVQDEMGITGTTAKEASTTIQGSLSSMKGAWQNLLTGLGDENADIDGLIENLLESVTTVLSNIIPRVKIIISGIIKMVKDLLPQIPPILQDMLPDLIDGVMGLISGIVEVLPSIVQALVDILPQILTALLGMLPSILDAVIQIILGLVDGITAMLPTIINAVMDVLPKLINALIDAIPLLLDAAIQLLMAIVDALPTIISRLLDALPDLIQALITVILTSRAQIAKAALQLFLELVKAIPKIIPDILKAIPNIIKSVVAGIKDGIPSIKEAGKEMIKGLWNGIDDMTDWIKEKISGFGKGVVDGLKKFFKIKSPSRLMEDVIGKNLALGIGEGFEDNIGKVNDTLTSAMNFEDPSININASKSGRLGGITVNQYNTYSQAHSRLELYKTKQQTAAAVRLAVGTV